MKHGYQFNLKTAGIPELHDNETAVEYSELCLKLILITLIESRREDDDCWPSPDYMQAQSKAGKR